MQPYKLKFLIDLDGVLNQYTKYQEGVIPPIKPGAREFLEKLHKEYKDCELYLFTSRNLLLAAKWLVDNNLDKYFIDVTNIKTPAYLMIDDRSVCFQGDYEKLIKDIKNYKAWWKITYQA